MRNRSKLMLAGLTAAVVLGAFASAASARRLAFSEWGWRATWNTLKFVYSTGITCHVTLEGTFHSRTISKVLEQLIGYVTKAVVDETHCTGGSARALTSSLPWHTRYAGFTGMLPNITSVKLNIIGAEFLHQVPQVPCLYASSAATPLRAIMNINATTHVATSLRPDETAGIPRVSGDPLFCAVERVIEGVSTSFTTDVLTTVPITVTLVQ